jgi:hypothetical protein
MSQKCVIGANNQAIIKLINANNEARKNNGVLPIAVRVSMARNSGIIVEDTSLKL